MVCPLIHLASSLANPLAEPVIKATLFFKEFIILCFICFCLIDLTIQRWFMNMPLHVQGLQQELQISKIAKLG